MYPALICNERKLRENVRVLLEETKKRGIEMTVVVKGVSAWKEFCEILVSEGVKSIADSRVINLKKIKSLEVEKILLRIPMLSEVKEVITHTDISFNSEIFVIRELNKEAKKQNKVHKIVLMIDIGDLREGILPNRLEDYINEIMKLENIEFLGIATNITCYGGVLPSKENLGILVESKKIIKEKIGRDIEIVSGGNSSSFLFLIKDLLPLGINNLRFGEVLLLGRETETGNFVDILNNHIFKLETEIIEIKEKPSVPIGKIGVDGFGNIPNFKDKGIRKRAIVGIGRQDINIGTYTPIDEKIEVLGASSDHMIIDITDSENEYKIGDIIEFNINYEGLLSLSTSEYVYKKIV
ncbi:MAG: alanine/ornithine racemase family PLP-dependent enzyme [Fusobacterium gastrosuis]|uniref:alanine/ornithine racemase family PLP-dependent enzyme n=1 Tax=Fusobacterium TaxID=848 RepID=UPI0025B7E0E9|nr:alanine/ornithine racemase family PLP-dependent enzyme [Fusobacterium sp.]MCI7224435.1 alanine/ornithine racemase family PLP-dependent enzyme [Fusobacterium sp.]MDY5795358.1 alanine/ornithine racemase family PLP-dependent enzyme [Fusobacterium gastrosuis]